MTPCPPLLRHSTGETKTSPSPSGASSSSTPAPPASPSRNWTQMSGISPWKTLNYILQVKLERLERLERCIADLCSLNIRIQQNSYCHLSQPKNSWIIFSETDKNDCYQIIRRHLKLISQTLSLGDSGRYRCRVDYFLEQTTFHLIDLVVVVPPDRPNIFIENGLPVNTRYTARLNSAFLLKCQALGGFPPPALQW